MDKLCSAGEHGAWTVRSNHRPILGEEEHDALVAWLGDEASSGPQVLACGSVVVKGTPMQLPEILFGNNALEFRHQESGFILQFEARAALKKWVDLFAEGAFEVIKVREAQKWQTRTGTPIRKQEYDWTWGTDYAGSCRRQDVGVEYSENGDILQPLTRTGKDTETPVEWVACEPGGIDRQMLLDQSSPILMYDDVVLFEDFIHDHGVVRLSVKTRVMPGFWFVLLRYWLRVDGVVMKVFDTRCFHKFGELSVFRERTQHSVSFTSLEQRGLSTDPSAYPNAESALPVLDLLSGPLNDCTNLLLDEAKIG
ncbi:unnamed protein product [Ectocarpus sp. 4 AP-2014]